MGGQAGLLTSDLTVKTPNGGRRLFLSFQGDLSGLRRGLGSHVETGADVARSHPRVVAAHPQ